MDLQKKLIQLSQYHCTFEYVDSHFLISIQYPKKWNIIPSEDRVIEVAEQEGITYYAAPIDVDIAKAFELIEDTISYNLDVEKKMTLLQYNIKRLQEMFAEHDLDELETIEITFKAKKKKPRQNAPKQVTEQPTYEGLPQDVILCTTKVETTEEEPEIMTADMLEQY